MNEIEQAVEVLKSGNLAILPTETVYGLFADATNQSAVEQLYAVKGRPTEKALNLNIADFVSILKFSKNQPAYLEKLVTKFLPGPLTIILEAADSVPEWVHIGKSTIGFRMPSIPVTQEIIRDVGVLVGPSANLTGSPSPRFFDDLSAEILSAASISVKDDAVSGLDTTILDLSAQPKVLRQGAITKRDIMEQIPEMGEIL